MLAKKLSGPDQSDAPLLGAVERTYFGSRIGAVGHKGKSGGRDVLKKPYVARPRIIHDGPRNPVHARIVQELEDRSSGGAQ